VLTGTFDGLPNLNPQEVANFRWISLENLITEVHLYPEQYTSWFQIILKQYLEHLSA
jgi:isopentenyl-diphosphate delta-isomerase